jgi:hypothetical protein
MKFEKDVIKRMIHSIDPEDVNVDKKAGLLEDLDIINDEHKRLMESCAVLMNISSNPLLSIVYIHLDLFGIYVDLYRLISAFKYYFRKQNILNKKILAPFNESESIELLLYKVVDAMLHVKKTTPITKVPYSSYKNAYAILDNFKKHGHYLPNLSESNDEHTIGNIILYLRYVSKTINKIYKSAVLPTMQKFPIKED